MKKSKSVEKVIRFLTEKELKGFLNHLLKIQNTKEQFEVLLNFKKTFRDENFNHLQSLDVVKKYLNGKRDEYRKKDDRITTADIDKELDAMVELREETTSGVGTYNRETTTFEAFDNLSALIDTLPEWENYLSGITTKIVEFDDDKIEILETDTRGREYVLSQAIELVEGLKEVYSYREEIFKRVKIKQPESEQEELSGAAKNKQNRKHEINEAYLSEITDEVDDLITDKKQRECYVEDSTNPPQAKRGLWVKIHRELDSQKKVTINGAHKTIKKPSDSTVKNRINSYLKEQKEAENKKIGKS